MPMENFNNRFPPVNGTPEPLESDPESMSFLDSMFNEDVSNNESFIPWNYLDNVALPTYPSLSVPQPSLHTPTHLTPVQPPQNIFQEEVDMKLFKEEEESNPPPGSMMATPLMVLTLEPWAGYYNFKVTIPEPNMDGVKPKWCFSNITNKLYVAKNIPFPLHISMDHYMEGVNLVVCPVYTKNSFRMVPVFRCPNCLLKDPREERKNHVLQVENPNASYYSEENRSMLAFPLGAPAPGDSVIPVFLKVTCNTSCVGGPHRRQFSARLSLRVRDREIGRQVIHIKACEGPIRDMGNDEKKELKTNAVNNQQQEDREKIQELVVSAFSTNGGKKRKKIERTPIPAMENSMKTTMLPVPERYLKQTKEFLNSLYYQDVLKSKKTKLLYEIDSD